MNVQQEAKDIEVVYRTLKKFIKKIKWRREKILLLTPVTHVENNIFIMIVHTKTKNIFAVKKGHKKKQKCQITFG